MDRGEIRWHGGLACPSIEADGNVTEVVGLLREAVTALDQMWHEALLSASPHAVMELGDASHSVHRALIALSQPDHLEATVEISRTRMVGAGLSGYGPAGGAPVQPPCLRRRQAALRTKSASSI